MNLQPFATDIADFEQSIPARTTNTNFVISNTWGAFVSYSPVLSATTATALLTGTSTGTATCELQIRPVGGAFTTIARVSVTNSVTYTIVVGINLATTDTKTMCLAGYVPPGYEVRLNVTTSGTASVSMTSAAQQETLYK